MRTAEEMYDYCLQHRYGQGMTKGWAIKHFRILEENLREDEIVYMAFIGLKNYISATNHQSNYGFAITNERIIFGQKKMIGNDFKSVVLDRINDISSSIKLLMGIVTIDTLGEIFSIGVDRNTAENISKEAHRIIFDMRSGKLAHDSVVNVETRERKEDPISKIKEYKELLDMGIISDEEFNIKKKELLGF